MRTKFFLKLCFFILLGCGAAACGSQEKDSFRPLSFDRMYAALAEMNALLSNSTFGTEDGTYPVESAAILETAIENLQEGLSKGLAGMLILQYEVDGYCIAAEKAIAEFKETLQVTLLPGTPAELRIFGIDGKGHIEFGEDPAFAGGNAFTVESWLKYDKGFYEAGIGSFISTFDGRSPNEGWMVNFMGDNLRTTIAVGPESGVLEHGSAYPTNYGEWNHIVAVWDNSLSENQLKMYVNGEVFFVKTNDTGRSYAPNTRNPRMWAFQEAQDHGRCMTGYIKKFRFWSTAKSEDEVKALMKTEVEGNEAGLVCAWDFTEVVENSESIPDKTGKFTARIVGSHKWYKADSNQ